MPDENEVSLYDYIKVISKWKWFIIIGTFVFFSVLFLLQG